MRIPKVISNSAIYTVIALIQKCIMFFLLPLYTAYLSPESYGIMSVVTSVTNFLSIFILYSLTSTATRFYYKNRDPNYASQLWGTLIIIVLINSIIIGSIAIIFHKHLIDPITGGIPFYPFMFIGILTVIVSPLYLFFQSYLQTIQDGKRCGINGIMYFVLQVSLTVIFLTVYHLGVLGVLLANLITTAVFFTYAFFFFAKKVVWKLNKDIAKPALKYATPLLPHHLFAWSSDMIDKLMLNSMASTSTTGLYSAAQQFGGIINMIAVSVNRAYAPWFYDKIGSDKGKIIIPQLSYLLIFAYSMIALLISLFSKEIITIMVSESFHEVWGFVPFLCFANVFQGVYFIFSNYLFLNKTHKVFLCTMFGAMVVVVFNLFLIPKYGVKGTIISAAIAMVVKSFVCYLMARKTKKFIPVSIVRMLAIIIPFFFVSLIVFPLADMNIWFSVAIKIIIVLTIVVFVWFKYKELILNFIRKNENTK